MDRLSNRREGREVMAVKFQKIIVWTAIETFGDKGSKTFEKDSAVDWVSPALDAIGGECQILAIESEEYELVKVEKEK